MKRFFPARYINTSHNMGQMRVGIQDGKELLRRDSVCDDLRQIISDCDVMSLTGSSSGARRLLQMLEEQPSSSTDLLNAPHYHVQALSDEFDEGLFIHITPEARGYLQSAPFGAEVANAFPSASFDISEAGGCLAFDRGTACVFHLMRVMEVALRLLGDSLKLPISTNRTWDSILRKCDQETSKRFADKSAEWMGNEVFLSGAAAHLRNVKDAWRNPTMHVEAKYTEDEARNVFTQVQSFMRHLATQLAEPRL